MSSGKLEYDSNLGGSVVLDENVQTYRYAAANITEIKELLSEIQNPTSTKLAFQTLPKHMRRRAMSHHPKRLPRQYRGIHKAQMAKAGKPTQTKRPSRKYRRKPSNLLKEYLRRQQKSIWLETHIWHAKRFHMVSKWGYKLPYASCDKTYRACYRATAKHCLLQDISFYGCIEIKGHIEVIKSSFQTMTSPECGLGITAKSYTTGRREGQIELFKSGAYPRSALGKVNFMWKPAESCLEMSRTLWIFVHSSFYQQVLSEIIQVFDLHSTKTVKVPMESDDDNEKFMTKTVAFTSTPMYTNDSTGVTVTELKDTINRFRLTGPLSQSVLSHALKVKPVRTNEPQNWFSQSMQSEVALKAHNAQSHFWENCKGLNSPAELLSNMIVGLNVEDPRLSRPIKRSKAIPEKYQADRAILLDPALCLPRSDFWDIDLRKTVTQSMLSTHDYCTNRNKNAVVPGERCKFEDDMQPVPIILIQRPGSQENSFKRLGYGSGWDLIVPSGYGMSTWVSLIMWGAKPGGLRELNSIKKELGMDEFLPDTISGKQESSIKCEELREKYFRLPPNKRCNYKKLAICSPFKVPFMQLVREWSPVPAVDTFHILRNKETLNGILKAIQSNKDIPPLPHDGLVPITLKMKTRGNPGDFAIICLPKKEDYKRNWKQIKFHKNDPIYTEPLHSDDKESIRRNLKKEHKKLLKRLRARRVREKRKHQETSERRVKIRPAATNQIVAEQYKKMCDLWMPESPQTVRNQCSREVFGYVTQSDFSFTEATVTAVGYVTIEGLRQFLKISKQGEKMVLVRGTKSRHYRFASFKINCQI